MSSVIDLTEMSRSSRCAVLCLSLYYLYRLLSIIGVILLNSSMLTLIGFVSLFGFIFVMAETMSDKDVQQLVECFKYLLAKLNWIIFMSYNNG